MARFDLTDFEWSVIEPLLPTKVRGVPRVDDRRVLNGIFWRLAARGVWANIKPMPNRKRRPVFSAFLYRYRNLVEPFFSKLKQFRAVATRYDKRDDNFLASVQLASIRIWLRHNESVA
jgi:transposase